MADTPNQGREAQGSDDQGEQSIDLLETALRVAAILRRRWLVVATTTVLATAAMILFISTLRPYWRASATVVVRLSGPAVLDRVKGVNEEDLWTHASQEQYYETQREIVTSRRVLSHALDSLGLASDPMFLGVDQIKDPAEREAVAAAVDPLSALQGMVSVSAVQNSRITRISAEYPDPEVAADIANAVAKAYVKHVEGSRSDTGREAKVDLEDVRKEAKTKLLAAEQALDEFKSEHEITSISLADRQNLITQNITTLSSRSKSAQAERIELAATYREAKRLHKRASKGDSSGTALASLVGDSQRQFFNNAAADRLKAEREFKESELKYGAKHPEYRRAKNRLDAIDADIQRELDEVLASVEAQFRAAQQSEKDLKSALESEHKKALELGRLEPKYRELEREVMTTQESYSLVARRDTEVGMTNEVERAPVEVLDEATIPGGPVRPRKTSLLALAIIGGLCLGSVLAVGVDMRDLRIRGRAELERAISGFGVPVLGQLPLIPADPALGIGNIRAQRRQRDLYTHLFPQSLMAERCRGVRTSLAFALSEHEKPILLVTSPNSAEGKSSTAMNLALSFCQANKRVCLVDADMRRPRLHQVFPPPVERGDVGLSAVLSGEANIDAVLQHNVDGAPELLSVVTCGSVPDQPAELLDSPNARRLFEDLRARFDIVVIDSPPVLPVTDPLILAPRVGGVIVVARCEATQRADIQRCLGQLRQGDTNLLGVVLNEVDLRREGKGYKSGYYHYYAREAGAERAY